MNRGSDAVRRLVRDREAGFNEAPIHESGKSSGIFAVVQDEGGFNEAPIHESGKY